MGDGGAGDWGRINILGNTGVNGSVVMYGDFIERQFQNL